MRKITKNILGIFLILFALSIIFPLFLDRGEKAGDINVSDFILKIKNSEVKSIEIQGNTITAKLKDDSTVKTLKESDASFTETLKNYGVSQEALEKVNVSIKEESGKGIWLGVVLPNILPLVLFGVLIWLFVRSAQKGAGQIFSFSRANIRMFNTLGKLTMFKDVAGLKEAKEELQEVVEFLKNPDKFFKLGAKIPRGVLLVGPTGTGKTMLARAVAGEANVPFFHMSGSEFVEMFVGVGANRVRDLFQTAKKQAPAIVFIDEIDAVGRHRGAGLGGGHDEREQTLNQILVEMDGFENETRLVVVAATNRPDILDPALLRPGRFDRRIAVDLPDINEREEILKIHSQDKPLAKNINLRRLAERTAGFSGADLSNLMNEAAILTARHNKSVITNKELFVSVEKVILGPERRSHVMSKKEREIAAFHEAGHAIVAASFPDSDPVHKISIISRGRAGGYTLKVPSEDKNFRSRREFQTDLATALGGYAAEEIVFGDITTGASSDLQRATELARKMVTKFGMSELGPITFGEGEELIFLGKEIGHEKNYSEELAAKIDDAVIGFIKNAYETAKNILNEKRGKLQQVAQRLLQKEVIEKEEFEALMVMV